MSAIKCGNCNYESLTFDMFMDLSVPIASKSSYKSSYYGSSDSVSLSDCLAELTKEEDLDTDYRCESCSKRGNCKKKTTIYTLPKILVIHLKRFKFSSYSKSKISTSVSFPITGLDLSEFS